MSVEWSFHLKRETWQVIAWHPSVTQVIVSPTWQVIVSVCQLTVSIISTLNRNVQFCSARRMKTDVSGDIHAAAPPSGPFGLKTRGGQLREEKSPKIQWRHSEKKHYFWPAAGAKSNAPLQRFPLRNHIFSVQKAHFFAPAASRQNPTLGDVVTSDLPKTRGSVGRVSPV